MSQGFAGLIRTLNRLFWGLTLPAVAFLGVGYLVHRMDVTISPSSGSLRAWGIALLILAALLGVALPILLRTLFNRQAVNAKRVEMEDFVVYQRRLVAVPMSALYVAGVAYLLRVPGLYLYGSVLCGLYGIYSAIPQERKLRGEMRFYGLGER